MFPDTLIEKQRNTPHLVILTGAGVSAESSIATFRDALTGLWKNYDAETLASEFGFRADPALVWGWYEWRLLLPAVPTHEDGGLFLRVGFGALLSSIGYPFILAFNIKCSAVLASQSRIDR